MNDFIEKWKTDDNFKTKTKLILYTAFVIFVAIFALAGNPNNLFKENENKEEIEETTTLINFEKEPKYTINVEINNDDYQFEVAKDDNIKTITKIINNKKTNYVYEQNNYYKEENEEYILTEKENVYDPVNYNYLTFDTINKYFSKSTKEKDKYITYLKDIILGNNSEEYITIVLEENKIDNKNKIIVDYTSLMKNFDKEIEKYSVTIETQETE